MSISPKPNLQKLRFEELKKIADKSDPMTAELIRRLQRIDDIVCGGTRGQKLIDILARAIEGRIKEKQHIRL